MKQAIWIAVLAVTLLGGCQTEEPPATDEISMPSWAESGPKAADYFRVYPLAARRLGIESDVRLLCTIRADRKLDCKPNWEEYPGYGFDVAGLAVSSLFVVKRSDNPNIQPGKEVVLPISFRLTD